MPAIQLTDDNTGRVMLVDRARIIGLTQEDGRTVVLFGANDVEIDGIYVTETMAEMFAMWTMDFRPAIGVAPLVTKASVPPAYLTACKAALPPSAK